ncbi:MULTISPECIES: hypothetical protein [Corynebacterium]|uniref:hypothetical protein n=1 Tax=Corynebacterium TaxID=1716 RepID=UPI00124EE2FA|nr:MULTISPECIES: hypothetical protein [Corynebacterium]
MKLYKARALALVTTASLVLAGCGSEDSDSKETETSSSTSSSTAAVELPTLEQLNGVLARATDPNLPIEERVLTVQNGDQAPELFDVMTRSKQESGANFQVVDPILPGWTPDSVMATIHFTLPDREPQIAEGVEFVNEDGHWKVSQDWACTVVNSTVAPEEVPAFCKELPAPAPVPEDNAPEGKAPAPEGEVPPAPEAEVPPAPEGAPAPQ